MKFATELDRVFTDRLAAAACDSRLRSVLWFLFLIADTIASGLAERVRTVRRGVERRWRPTLILGDLVTDTRWTLRHLRHAPAFGCLMVVCLALGIGSTTAIFSVVNAVLLRPLPYADPAGLVAIWSNNTRQGQPANPVSPADFEAFRKAPSLSRVEAMFSFLTSTPVLINGQPDYVQVATITPGMFDLLGRVPMVGTAFRSGETTPRVVLSYGYWERRFGGDPNVVGLRIVFPGRPAAAIAGVMPADFTFPYQSMLTPAGFTKTTEPDLWWPLVPTPGQGGGSYLNAAGQPNRDVHYLTVLARLKPGRRLDQIRTDLNAIASQVAVAFPDSNRGWTVTVRTLRDQTVGVIQSALFVLAAGVAVVLLITCVNIANVVLARGMARGHDLAVRSALGASRFRLTQEATVESLLLAGLGGAFGLALTVAAVRTLVEAAPSDLPRMAEVSIDLRVALIAFFLSVATGLLVGLVPALITTKSAASDALRESRRTTASAAARRLRSTLITAEVALATTLAVVAVLLLRSFVAVLGVDPGFHTSGLLTMQLNVPIGAQQDQRLGLAFYDNLEARLRALPGVVAVGGTTRLPLDSSSVSTVLHIDGRPATPDQMPEVELRRAVFDYFDAMGIPIVLGRSFQPGDGPATPTVAIVDTAFVAKIFPNEDPIGRRVQFGRSPTAPFVTIVGVCGSVRHTSLEETPKPELYLYYRQSAPVQPFIVIQSSTDPTSLVAPARQAVQEAGGEAPFDVKTMRQLRQAAVAERWFVLRLVGLFGAIALALSAVGVYGVVTLVAAERRAEVGIRLALGAQRRQVFAMFLGQTTRIAAAGIALGTVASLVIAPMLASQLFEIRAFDPATYGSVAATVIIVAVLAAARPASLAIRENPVDAIR